MYESSFRGRDHSGGFGFDMFPEKYESTELYESPDQVNNFQREICKDFSPDTTNLLAHEETRRNVHSEQRLNLREGGFYGSTASPFQYDTDLNLQFHDADPRGFLVEQNWREHSRLLRSQLERTDYKDDGDYSITGGGISPETLYKQIRGTHNWIRTRMKIFSTAMENRHVGGVGVYDNVSGVFKSEYEDTSVMVDGTRMSSTFEDPENRARLTMKLSNYVHSGGELRSLDTTDHRVPVAAYGKLMSQRGLIPHETQLRMVEDDRKYNTLAAIRSTNKNIMHVLDAMTNEDLVSKRQKTLFKSIEGFAGKNSEQTSKVRSQAIVKDIMALFGITENEIQFLSSKAQGNNQQAQHALANIQQMVETMQHLPFTEKLTIRQELIAAASTGGLLPGNNRSALDRVVMDQKIVSFIQNATSVRRTSTPGDTAALMRQAESSAELKKWISDSPGQIFKSVSPGNSDINRREGVVSGAFKSSARAHKFKNFRRTDITNVGYNGAASQDSGESIRNILSKHGILPENLTENKAELDNVFLEAVEVSKKVGVMGNKRAGVGQVLGTM